MKVTDEVQSRRGSGQHLYVRAVLIGGGSDVQGEQLAQGVHGQMHLRALLALGSVVAASIAALGVERATVEQGDPRAGRSTLS